MTLAGMDWLIIGIFFVVLIFIGLIASRRAGSSSAEFFLGGRSMPWWLLGVSMVACTFSCDTPNLVTGLVRGGGVVKNWCWWAFLITGMTTVFIYAQLWRRSRVMTDLEFYELRYSGKSAAFIRGFRSLYLGVFFNCLIMGSVTLAAIKIGQVIFDVEPWVAVVLGSVGVVIYATVGGIKSCLWADFFQYAIAMAGAIYAAVIACRQPEVQGLSNLLTHPNVVENLSWMPDFSTWLAWVPLLLIPVAVQWWSVWYPGAEPGGGGYIAQRMLAAKNEKHAIGATLFFNFMHYAMRPWPWIIVALASMVCYPTLDSIKTQFPGIDPTYLAHDIAYPVMISKLGPGFLGLVVASLIAAYMSTIGTHLNWGSSYVVNDWYRRFVNPNAQEKELVKVGRICTVVLMVIAGFFALAFLQNANQAFDILLLSGAGTGGIYLLRWFWWRINAWTEIVAMIAATVLACWLVLVVGDKGATAWCIRSGAVSDRVLVIDDATQARWLKQQQDSAEEKLQTLDNELETLADAWREARREGPAVRDAARAAFEAKQSEINTCKAQTAIPALLNAMTESGWQRDLQRFYDTQKQWELERTNQRRVKNNLAPKTLADVTPAFAGIVAGDKIYIYHPDVAGLTFSVKLIICVAAVTLIWLLATLVTKPADKQTLRSFYRLCHPGGPGWRKVVADARADGDNIDPANSIGDWKLPMQILGVFVGCVAIYSALFAVGNFVYGKIAWGIALSVIALAAIAALFKLLGKIGIQTDQESGQIDVNNRR